MLTGQQRYFDDGKAIGYNAPEAKGSLEQIKRCFRR